MLILYPLDGKTAGVGDEGPVMGIAISFPASDTARAIDYIVTNVFMLAGDYDSL
jgi:hypothetical protein